MPFETSIPENAAFFAHIKKELVINPNCKNGSITKDDFLRLKQKFAAAQIISEKENAFCSILLPDEAELDDNLKKVSIRQYFFEHTEKESFVASRSRSVVIWHSLMRFCPTCGTALELSKNFSCKICTKCGKEYFPRIEPCVIVLIKKDDEVLLVRHKNRNQDIFACVAGFIESGESAESAVHREVMEETGLKIKNLCYKGSQSWPFPDQLMLAFTAEYESGTIKIQESELKEAQWFKKNALPKNLPKPGSVAYKLINELF